MKLTHLLPISIFAACVVSVPAEIVFQGYVLDDGRPSFALSGGDDHRSRWIHLGESFGGITVSAFDPKTEILTVERKGVREALHLSMAKIQLPGKAGFHDPKDSLVLAIDGLGVIPISDDAGALDALKARLSFAATMVPQPTVYLHAPQFTKAERVLALVQLCSSAGIKKVSFVTGDRPTGP